MNKNAPEIVQLRLDIENNVSRRIRTPYDFEFLAGAIWERLHDNISPTTLKRLWGYIDGADTTRRTTLCLMARFLGYADWEDYCRALSERTDVESRSFMADGVHTSDLEIGRQVEVAWLPNRRCVFRYDGNGAFTVLEAVNAKIHEGDTFTCAYFLLGQPMYLDNLVPSCSLSLKEGQSGPMSYVAGSKGGLVSVRLF